MFSIPSRCILGMDHRSRYFETVRPFAKIRLLFKQRFKKIFFRQGLEQPQFSKVSASCAYIRNRCWFEKFSIDSPK